VAQNPSTAMKTNSFARTLTGYIFLVIIKLKEEVEPGPVTSKGFTFFFKYAYGKESKYME